MKKLLLSIYLIAPLLLTGQISLTQEDVSYKEVVELQGNTKEKLFKNAKIWYVEKFTDSREVIQVDDIESGKIVGRGYSEFTISADNWANALTALGGDNSFSKTRIEFVIKTYFKENKARLVIDNTRIVKLDGNRIISETPLADSFFKKNGKQRSGRQSLKLQTMTMFKEISDSFKESLKEQKEDSDW